MPRYGSGEDGWSGMPVHSKKGSCEPSWQFRGSWPGLFLKLPLPTSCSQNMRAAAWLMTGEEETGNRAGSRILKSVNVPLTGYGHLISAHRYGNRKGLHRELLEPSALRFPYLRGLSLNRVPWLPVTELPPLLLSSSAWE